MHFFLLLLFLSALAGACGGGPPPEERRPEITLENIREDINGKQVRVPSENDSAETSGWRFYPNEPKEIEIVEKQMAGDQATFVIEMRTRTSPRAEQQGNDEFLFDLTVDQREQADFKEKNPDVLKRIRTEYQRWESQMLPLPERRTNSEE